MPNDRPKIELELDVENIGPHENLSFSTEVNSLKAIFYARNGIGKSFISRTFRLLSPEKTGFVPDDLLTLGQTSASLNLKIVPAGAMGKSLNIFLQKGSQATIRNDLKYLFHVFNSEYVEENIRSLGYTPDGNISGYILGKAQIDLTDERKQEAQLNKEIENKEKEIDDVIRAAQKELQDNGIRTNQKEFSLISREELRRPQAITCERTFYEMLSQLHELEKLPEGINDIVSPDFIADTSVLDDASRILGTVLPNSEWDKDFALSVKRKRDFVEKGLELIDGGSSCPFCEQPLGVDALSLIQQYKAFLADKEAQTIKQIEATVRNIKQIVSELRSVAERTEVKNAEVGNVVKYFPSLKDSALSVPDYSANPLTCFEQVISSLESKMIDISKVDQITDSEISKCVHIIDYVKKICADNAKTSRAINSQKNNSNRERLELRRNLCKAQYLRISAKLTPTFNVLDEKNADLEKLVENIKNKEALARVSKKEKVYEAIEYWLNRFFAGKYTIDRENFFIRFRGTSHSDASKILSDGEKSIVAFCFYLASTHLLVERKKDYGKLFFIIDDPISSMDFNYVYTVAQSLRDLKEFFDLERLRLFVFTHNLEFYSIAVRNHALTHAYVMRFGEIEPLEKQLLMPYEHHLSDIVRTARGESSPSHTIGNSIRHVLETVSRFEHPERRLEKYIAESNILKDNSCIYSLCQDLSHGAMRTQPPFDKQILKEACNVVVSFMEEKYSGQISAIKSGTQASGQDDVQAR